MKHLTIQMKKQKQRQSESEHEMDNDLEDENDHNQSDENITQSNKQGKLLRTLRMPFYKWQIISLDLKTQQIFKEQTRTRSSAWVIYRKFNNELGAVCRICGHENRARYGNTTQLLRHIDQCHLELRKQIQQKFDSRNSSSSDQCETINLIELGNQVLQQTKKAEKMKFQEEENQDHQYKIKHNNLKKSMDGREKSQTLYQTHVSQVLKIFKTYKGIQVSQQYFEHQLISAVVITKFMKEKIRRYSDTLSFWHFPKPTQSQQLKSVVYIVSQNENLGPVILGIVLIFTQSLWNFQFLRKIFENYIPIPQEPQIIVVCGPSWLLQCFKQFTEQIKGSHQVQYNPIIVNVEAKILQITDVNFLEFICAKYIQIVEIQYPTSLIGFTFTLSFIDQLKNLTPERQGFRSNLEQFLVQICQIQIKEHKRNSMRSFCISAHDKRIIAQPSLKNIFKSKQFQNLKNIVCEQVLFKLAYAYLFVKSSLFIEGQVTSNKIIVKEILKPHFWKTGPKFQLFFDNIKEKWVCSCKLYNLSGLPCPHLICVLFASNKSIKDYIHQRWLPNRSFYLSKTLGNQNRINLAVIEHTSQKNEEQNIELNDQLQVYFSEERFLSMFWL